MAAASIFFNHTSIDENGHGWTDDKIRHHVLEKQDQTNYTEFDPDSIMLYPISKLKSGDFDNLTGLESLGIGGTFSALPDGIFDHLVYLKTLGLMSSQLRSLPNGIFDQLTILWSFGIADTPLSSLPDGIFDKSTGLSYLAITGTQLSSLPDGIFDHLTNVPFIILSNNQLGSLPRGVFDKATMTVDLSNNQLRSLPDGIFAGIFDTPPDLTGFNIVGIPTGPIPEARLPELGEYTTLNLTGNLVDPLPLTISLEKVGNRQFKAVAPTGAPSDIVLPIHVWYGSITGGATTLTIPVGAVESETLTVTRNSGAEYAVTVNIGTLPELPKGHSGYTLVQSADLPPTFTELGGRAFVRAFVPVSQRTPQVRDAIVRAVQREAPSVQSAADVTEAHLTAITRLNLELTNPVKASDFDGLTGLTELSLATALTSLPVGFLNEFSNLTVLSWEDLELSSLPTGVFDNLTNLTELYVGGTELSSLPAGVFDNLTNLTELDFSAGQLTSLPDGIFDQLTNLTRLGLSGTQLEQLPDGIFDELTKLTKFSLGRTQLTSLPDGLLSGLSSLTSLVLFRNAADPLPLTVSLEKVAEGQFKAVVPSGAPFNILLPISVTNGRISGGATRITITTGSVESEVLTVTRTAGTTAPVTVDIDTLPGLPTDTQHGSPLHSGYTLVKSTDLPLTLTTTPNAAPVFTDGTSTTRTIAENTAANTNIGSAVSATDSDNDTLTYTLGGTDAASFSINSTTGQLQTRAVLDYETKTTYTVTITVSDGNGGSDSIAVTINVMDVNETPANTAPVFTDGTSTTRTIAENTAAGQNIGTVIAATDADSGDTLTYTLSGTDAASFSIDSTSGQLQTKAALDYETKSTYTVTLTVSDGSLTATITVTDINELPTTTAICKVGDVIAPGESCTYPGTDAVFSVLADGSSQWNIPNLPTWLEWINQTSVSNSIRVSTTVNGQAYHFVAEQLADNSWEIKEIGDDTTQQPETPEQPKDAGTSPTLSVSTAAPLTEAMLHGGIITLNLSNGTFERSMFWIRNAISVSGITGVDVESFGGKRISDTQATIELEYAGNMTANGTLTIALEAGGIKDYDGATLTAQIPVTAVTESVAASTAAPLTEATLDESIVTLTLSGAKYASSIWDIRDAVSVSGINGVTKPWNQPKRKSDTEITVELEFDGDMTTDGTLIFTVGADAIAGYNGPALTTQVTVTADRENVLFANFPNPFNPETWIPYQLEKPTEVTITIYAIDGKLVRTLDLGHQAAGIYQTRSRAAYWDGRNAFGEPVASGVYFYTLTAGDFTATRKMLIRK